MRTLRAAVTALLLLQAACGGGSGGSGGAPTPAASTPSTPPEPPAPPPGPSTSTPPSTDLVAVSFTGPSEPVPGGATAQLTLGIASPGTAPAAAANVAAVLALGPGLTEGAVTCTAQNGATCPADPSPLVVESLPPGGRVWFSVEVSVTPGASGHIASTATVSAAGDTVTSNNSAEAVLSAYTADLQLTATTAGGDFYSGSLLTYSMRLHNRGPDAARNVTIQSVVGPDQALDATIRCVGINATCPDTTIPNMTMPLLPANGMLMFDIATSVAPGVIGPITHTLHASGSGDPLPSNNVATYAATVRVPMPPQSGSFVLLRSDEGDFVGQGRTYVYDRASATIDVSASGRTLTVEIRGNELWTGTFLLPSVASLTERGTYTGLQRYLAADDPAGGMSFGGEGRGCNVLDGAFSIDSVTHWAGELAAIDLSFEQRCEGKAAALHGQIHWSADDAHAPTGPVNPPPTGLWVPPQSLTPADGNYVYLESDPGEPVGQGRTYLYTDLNAVLSFHADGNALTVTVAGNEHWQGVFAAMDGVATLLPGYYGNVQEYPAHNPTAGGFDWNGDGRGCTSGGWFAVDNVAYVEDTLVAVDLRFEQRCAAQIAALRGKLHWRSADTVQAPGPELPPPAELWAPPQGATPATGRYVYLESDPGDFIAGGGTYLYTQANAQLRAWMTGSRLEVDVKGDEHWIASFQPMSTLAKLEPGYYPFVLRYPFHNPARGGLSWWGEGRACDELDGWFAVDSVTEAETGFEVELRFEQHCEHELSALRGKLRWVAEDPSRPPGPQLPPPLGLWEPPADAVPASGNYAYFASVPGDYIGLGRTYLYTPWDSVIETTLVDEVLVVAVNGDTWWRASFAGMDVLERLEPGYYGSLQDYPFHNPAKGGIEWIGDARGCGFGRGWFVVDEITYDGAELESVAVRFEQSCYGDPPAHGAIRWSIHDTTLPPGPQQPPPADLWRPADGATPAAGNYVYLESDPFDHVGDGRTVTFTPDAAAVTIEAVGRVLTIDIAGAETWRGEFRTMDILDELAPGYYPDLQRYPVHNPTKGALYWSTTTRGCSRIAGWVVVDSVTYAAGKLASIDLRFEQLCDWLTAPLHGEIHWIF